MLWVYINQNVGIATCLRCLDSRYLLMLRRMSLRAEFADQKYWLVLLAYVCKDCVDQPYVNTGTTLNQESAKYITWYCPVKGRKLLFVII